MTPFQEKENGWITVIYITWFEFEMDKCGT